MLQSRFACGGRFAIWSHNFVSQTEGILRARGFFFRGCVFFRGDEHLAGDILCGRGGIWGLSYASYVTRLNMLALKPSDKFR